MRNRLKFLCLLLCACFLLAGCQRAQKEGDGRPIVYASFFPIYDLCKSITGEEIDLRSFMPPEQSAHLWEPSPKDIRQLAEADMLIVNGANLERWVDQVAENLPNLKIITLSDTVELITYKGAAAIGDFQYLGIIDVDDSTKHYKLEFGHTHEDLMRCAFFKLDPEIKEEQLIKDGKKIMEQKGRIVSQRSDNEVEANVVYGVEMAHEYGSCNWRFPETGRWVFISDRVSEELLSYNWLDPWGEEIELETVLAGSSSGLDKITYDPHSWLSIVNAKRYLNKIYDELVASYPEMQRKFYKRKVKAIDELTSMEYEFKAKFKEVEKRNFVVTHYAYAYLARDFDLQQFPLQGLTSMEDPSLKTIRKAINYCLNHQLKTIFYELGGQKKGADTIAAELGGQTKPLASMEYRNREVDGKSFADLMRLNLENLLESME
ncbi:MAG: zinc ABC transporter substrate-binding protein [Eubacteriales bacterium]|nr:zinc ABC transporter substrate-binding protein [Eubacteriales bacterium]